MNIPANTDLTFGEIAALGRISTRTVRRLVKAGRLAAIRYNRKVVLVPLESWRQYRESALAASRHEASRPAA